LPKVTPLKVDLTYPEHPIKVLDQKDHVTRRKTIKFFKIQGSTILKKKQLWKARTFSVPTIQNFSYHSEGTCGYSYRTFLLYSTPSVTIEATVPLYMYRNFKFFHTNMTN
jgi:hypothetical protein